MKYETDEEFDDGGTPMWRARQEELRRTHVRQRVTITVPQKRNPKSLGQAVDMMTPAERIAVFLFGPFILYFGLMAMVIIGTVGYLIIHDTIYPPTPESDYQAALWQVEH